MAKRSNGFDKDPERARLAGRKSSCRLPEDLKDARLVNSNLFEQTIYKYMNTSVKDLEILMKDKTISARDMVVIRILALSLQQGDTARLEFLLSRTIGKVVDRVQLDARIQTKSLHDQIVDIIEVNRDK